VSTGAMALPRDAFAPRPLPGMRSGLLLALIVHALLIVALAWSVNWRTHEPEGIVAELWSALPQAAAPRAAPPEPAPAVVPTRPAPAPAPPQPSPAARAEAQIAVERAEAARKAEAARRDEARREEAERERQRLADEQAEKKKLAEKARQDEARQAAIRDANLRRMISQAGTSEDPAAAGTAPRTSGPSASYAGRIKARIKPNIVLTGSVSGNPLASVDLRLAPDGTIVGRKLVKSSGSPIWDETVLRAIDKTEVLPRDIDGRVPASMTIDFRPQE